MANNNNHFVMEWVWLNSTPQSGASAERKTNADHRIAGAAGASSELTFSLMNLAPWWRKLEGWAQPGPLVGMSTCGLLCMVALGKSNFLHAGFMYQ